MLEWWVADFFLSAFFHNNMVWNSCITFVHNNGNHAEQKSYEITFGEVGHILEVKTTKCRRGWTPERLGTHYFRICGEAVRSQAFRDLAASSFFFV